MNMTINTGTRVIASNDENPTASVLVHARGRNIRPSWASSKKTGRKDTTIITSEKNNAGPTCFAASIRIVRRSRSETSEPRAGGELTGPLEVGEVSATSDSRLSDRWRYPFSTITIAASTKTPIASARPPSDMMFELTRR